jgi:hypothetical protein
LPAWRSPAKGGTRPEPCWFKARNDNVKTFNAFALIKETEERIPSFEFVKKVTNFLLFSLT